MSRSIFHTDRKWVAGICYVGFLLLTLMLASFVFLEDYSYEEIKELVSTL